MVARSVLDVEACSLVDVTSWAQNLWEELIQPDGQTAVLHAEQHREVSRFQSQAVSSVSTEVAWSKIMEMGQARRGAVCESCCESGRLPRRADAQHAPTMS